MDRTTFAPEDLIYLKKDEFNFQIDEFDPLEHLDLSGLISTLDKAIVPSFEHNNFTKVTCVTTDYIYEATVPELAYSLAKDFYSGHNSYTSDDPSSSPTSSSSSESQPSPFRYDEKSMNISVYFDKQSDNESESDTPVVTKKPARSRKHKAKPGRPRKSTSAKNRKVKVENVSKSTKSTKKVTQPPELPVVVYRLTTPQNTSSSNSPNQVITSNSTTPNMTTASNFASQYQQKKIMRKMMKQSERSSMCEKKCKRRKCMSHTEKAQHNELERRRRAQMGDLLTGLRSVIDTVKDDPKASQKKTVDEALKCIKHAKRQESEMLNMSKHIRAENAALKKKLEDLVQWHNCHKSSKVTFASRPISDDDLDGDESEHIDIL